MKIEYDATTPAGRWIVTGGIRDAERVNRVPGSRAKRKTEPGVGIWSLPGTIGAARQLNNEVPELEWDESALRARKQLNRQRKIRLKLQKYRQNDRPRLSHAQNLGVDWLMSGNNLLADDMGAGKTVQACVAAQEGYHETVLILTTKSTLGVWEDHLREWTDIEPFIFHGTKSKQEKVYAAFLAHEGRKALIGTHASSGTHSKQLHFGSTGAEGEPGRYNEPFDLCIIDEIHKMGVNPKNKWVRSMWAIAANCNVRWGLTGTPINDNPEDLWVLMRFIEPDLLGYARGAFRERYCIMVDTGYTVENRGLHPDMEEEFRWLTDPYILRRLKREVVKDLPEALPVQYVHLPLSPQQSTAYKAMVKDMMAKIGDGILLSPDGLSQHQSCEYLADGLPVLDDDGRVVGLDTRPSTSNKMEYILDVAEQRKGDPFVVYAYSSKTIDMMFSVLEDKNYEVGKITGSTSQSMRDAYVKAFQSGQLDVLLMTDAGAEGLTLTAADLIIFARESWRAPTNQQVKDRIDRWGQERPPHTVVLLSEDTIDMSRRLAVEAKVAVQEQVLNDKKRLKALLTGTLQLTEEF